MAKKKVPTVEARCPMCKNHVEYVYTAEVTQLIESITDDEFAQPKLRKLNAGDVHDPGGAQITDRLVCENPTCSFDVPATQANLWRLRPENKEERK
jgi:hypothetical protein